MPFRSVLQNIATPSSLAARCTPPPCMALARANHYTHAHTHHLPVCLAPPRRHDPKDGERPVGLPINVVVRLRPEAHKTSSDARHVTVDGKTVKLGPGGQDTFNFNEVFGPSATQEDLFGKELRRLLKTTLEGYSATVLALGQTGSGKAFTMDGNVERGTGLVFMSVCEVFDLLKKKVSSVSQQQGQARSRYDSRQSTFRVTAEYFEVYNDTIHDLFNPQASASADLDVEYGEYGVFVPGATSHEIRHPDDFRELYVAAQRNRTQANSDFGPLRDRASVFVVLNIEQRLAPSYERLDSKLMFVVLPGTERLAEDPDTLRAREGPRLNRELLGLSDVVVRLSDPQTADFAHYTQSKTTMLLDDALGGNCITLCVATISPEDISGSRVTLDYAQVINQIVNYPVHNDERAVGMLRRLRLQIFQLRQELRNYQALGDGGGGGSGGGGGGGTGSNDAVVVDLKGRLIKSELDRTKLIKEKSQLVDRFAAFREKYTQLVKSKAELQAELIKSEEERLKVSKMLVDMQIENTDLKEKATTEKFDLEAKLLSVENDVVERQTTEQQFREENQRLKSQIEELVAEKKELAMEYVALRQNYSHVHTDLESEQVKAQEVGAELLTLVNTKNTLQAKVDELQERLQEMLATNRDLSEFKRGEDARLSDINERLVQMTADNERLKLEAVRKDVELTKTVSEFESMKTGLEKNYVQLAMERDKEVTALREAMELANKQLASRDKEASEEIHRLTAQLSVAHRRQGELETKLGEQVLENSELVSEATSLRQQLASAHEEFRSKLVAYITQVKDVTTSGVDVDQLEALGDERAGDALAENLQPSMEKMYKELLDTHNARERELGEEADGLRRRIADLVRKNRELSSHYRTLHTFATDVAPSGMAVPVLDDTELQHLTQATDEATQHRDHELNRLRETVNSLHTQLEQQKQLALAQAETFQRNSAALQKEYVRLKEDYSHLKKEHSRCGGSVNRNLIEDNRQAVEDLQSYLEKKFSQQISELQKAHSDRADREEIYALRDRVEVMRKENESLRKKSTSPRELNRLKESWQRDEENYKANIASLEDKVEELKKKVRQGGGSASRPGTGSAMRPEDVAALKKQMVEFQENTQRELEQERAKLKIKATQAEEELRNFQDYMKSEVPKYQKTIIQLRQEVAYWKTLAAQYGAPTDKRQPLDRQQQQQRQRTNGRAAAAHGPVSAWTTSGSKGGKKSTGTSDKKKRRG